MASANIPILLTTTMGNVLSCCCGWCCCCCSPDYVESPANSAISYKADQSVFDVYTKGTGAADEITFRGIKVLPFDLIFVRGKAFGSKLIMFGSELTGAKKMNNKTDKRLGPRCEQDDFSHVGIVITSAVLDHPNVKPGRVYIWESTHGTVSSVDGRNENEVQLRDLGEVLADVDYHNRKTYHGKWGVAVGKLLPEFRAKLTDLAKNKQRFQRIFNEYNQTPYNTNLSELLGAVNIMPQMDLFDRLSAKKRMAFCSQLIAMTYEYLELLPDTVDDIKVLPVDFLGMDVNGEIPRMCYSPWFIAGSRSEVHDEDSPLHEEARPHPGFAAATAAAAAKK
jgi:hypothetical protein